MPPVAVTPCAYPAPTVPFGKLVVVIVWADTAAATQCRITANDRSRGASTFEAGHFNGLGTC